MVRIMLLCGGKPGAGDTLPSMQKPNQQISPTETSTRESAQPCSKHQSSPAQIAWTVLESDEALVRSLCERAVREAQAAGDHAAMAWVRLTRALLCWSHVELQTLRDDIAWLDQWPAMPDNNRDLPRLIRAAQGFLQRRLGHNAQALAVFEALPLRSHPDDDDPDDHFVLYGLGLSAMSMSRFDLAIASLERALRLAERGRLNARVCTVACSLSAVLACLGRHTEKLALLDDIFQRGIVPERNPRLTTMLHANRALALSELGHKRKAFDAICSIEPQVELHAPGMLPRLHANLCEIAIDLARPEEAAHRLALAYEMAYAAGDVSMMGCCHVDAARLLRLTGDVHDALNALALAADCQAQCPDDNGPLAEIDRWLSECYADLGHFALAYQHHRRYHEGGLRRTADADHGRHAAARAAPDTRTEVMLSTRERECLRWCAAGKTAWETGTILGLSEWTVVYHLGKVKRKLGSASKQQMVADAVRLGLVPN
jgi:DNA-binding CsgD family transcriptional regulator